MEIISSNKLYDPLLDLNKVADGTLSKNNDAMTWIENFSVIQTRGNQRKKRNSATKGGNKILKVSPQLNSKDSIAIPLEVIFFFIKLLNRYNLILRLKLK